MASEDSRRIDTQQDAHANPSTDACESKQLLRQRALDVRAELSPEVRLAAAESAGARAVQLLRDQGVFGTTVGANDTLNVLTYATHGHEFPAEPVLEHLRAAGLPAGTRVVAIYPRVSAPGALTLHRCESADLIEGYRGIFEPSADTPVVDPSEVGLVLVPGVAFDEHAMRLGYGKGFYDRALAEMGPALKVGLSFDETLFPAVPCESHDFPLDAVVTPTRTVRGSQRL